MTTTHLEVNLGPEPDPMPKYHWEIIPEDYLQFEREFRAALEWAARNERPPPRMPSADACRKKWGDDDPEAEQTYERVYALWSRRQDAEDAEQEMALEDAKFEADLWEENGYWDADYLRKAVGNAEAEFREYREEVREDRASGMAYWNEMQPHLRDDGGGWFQATR